MRAAISKQGLGTNFSFKINSISIDKHYNQVRSSLRSSSILDTVPPLTLPFRGSGFDLSDISQLQAPLPNRIDHLEVHFTPRSTPAAKDIGL